MRRQAAAGRQTLRALFENVDALLYPPVTGEAPEGLADSGSAQFGALWSPMGVPCVAVPVATGPVGLPMGMQVIGGYGEDERTLAVAEVVSRVAVRVT
jgi:Asp-tRNA(Asn)/Glu-tRNA(Gln) amidotransferase A subunit family amidase